MGYILDTCVLLWTLNGDLSKLKLFKEKIMNTNNVIMVSMASYWEIAIKKHLGRIEIQGDIFEAVKESGFHWLNINHRHIDFLSQLPDHHHDPFDRLIIAQAKNENLEILTTDGKIKLYF